MHNIPVSPSSLRRVSELIANTSAGLSKNMAAINLLNLSDEQKRSFLDSFDTVITDCDGVLWHSKTPIAGAQEVMNLLPSINKKRFFFTNNSTLTRRQFVEKFKTLGFDASEDQILSTAWLAAQYLKNLNFSKKVYVIGSTAVEEELNNVGIRNFGAGADNYEPKASRTNLDSDPECVNLDPEVGAVLVGYDFYFSLPKLMKACSYLNNPDCMFIATNTDERFPITNNITIPGAGAFVAAVEKCSERTPQIVGKPSPLAIDSVLIPSGVTPNKCLMIGDRCNTDIHFGNQRGMTTLLVETGVHRLSSIQQFSQANLTHLIPSYYTSSIADLLKIMKL